LHSSLPFPFAAYLNSSWRLAQGLRGKKIQKYFLGIILDINIFNIFNNLNLLQCIFWHFKNHDM